MLKDDRKTKKQLLVELQELRQQLRSSDKSPALVSNSKRRSSPERTLLSEDKYRLLFKTMVNGIFYQQANGELIDVNPAALRIFGLTRRQFLGSTSYHPQWKVIHEDGSDFPADRHPSMVALKTGRPVKNVVAGVYNPRKQNYVWIVVDAIPQFRKGEGKPYQVFITLHDITDMKRAQQRLRDGELTFRDLFNGISSGIVVYEAINNGTDFIIKDINHSARQIEHVKKSAVAGKRISEVFPGIKEFGLLTVLQRVWKTGKPEHFPIAYYEDSRISGWRENYVYKLPQGEIVAIYNDVTAQKQAEKMLKASEGLYKSLVQNAGEGIWLTQKSRFLFVNKKIIELLGYSKAELLKKKFLTLVHPEDRELAKSKHMAREQNKNVAPYQIRLLDKNGGIRWFELNGVNVTFGNKPAVLMLAGDIKEKKLAVDEMREWQQKYHDLIESSPYGITVNQNGIRQFANTRFAEMLGYSKEEVIGVPVINTVYPDDRKEARSRFAQRLKGKTITTQYRALDKTGNVKWIENKGTAVTWNGKPAVFTFSKDITEEKKLEELLITSEKQYHKLIENSPYGITVTHDGIRKFCNTKFADMLGYSVEELTGIPVMESVHPDDHKEATLRILQRLKGKKVSDTRYRVFDKKGNIKWIETNGAAILWNNSPAVIAFAKDITDQKKLEDQLVVLRRQLRQLALGLQNAAEMERKKIAGDIHDDLGQSLTALQIDLSWLMNNIPEGQTKLIQKIKTMLNLINATDEKVKRIATELRPSILDDLGLPDAIQWMIEGFQKRTGICCHVTLPPGEININEHISIAFFRILQEILTNISRHAHATEIHATLKMERNRMIMTVTDNGKGLRKKDLANPFSIGLFGMKERMLALGGTLKIDSIKNKGTTITAICPLNDGDIQ